MDCQKLGNNHSTDKTKVWIGELKPLILCGFHASQLNSNLIRKIKG